MALIPGIPPCKVDASAAPKVLAIIALQRFPTIFRQPSQYPAELWFLTDQIENPKHDDPWVLLVLPAPVAWDRHWDMRHTFMITDGTNYYCVAKGEPFEASKALGHTGPEEVDLPHVKIEGDTFGLDDDDCLWVAARDENDGLNPAAISAGLETEIKAAVEEWKQKQA